MRIWYDKTINGVYIEGTNLPFKAGTLSCSQSNGTITIFVTETSSILMLINWANVQKEDGTSFLNSETCMAYVVNVLSINSWLTTPSYLVHIESMPSLEWNIVHGFGYYPQVQIYDNQGRQIEADVIQNNLNQLTISFGAAMDGKAILE